MLFTLCQIAGHDLKHLHGRPERHILLSTTFPLVFICITLKPRATAFQRLSHPLVAHWGWVNADHQVSSLMQVVTQRLMKLQTRGTPAHLPAEVLVKRRKRNKNGAESWEVVRARGHLDEVLDLRSSTATNGQAAPKPDSSAQLVLVEGPVLGGGAFSRVSICTGA